MANKALTGSVLTVAQGIYEENSAAQHNLGDTVFTNDGRAFRYCQAGATALISGNLQQAKVENTADQNLAVAAASVGATQIVTTSTVTVDANEYTNGFVVVSVTPSIGKVFSIKAHAAASAAALTINLYDPLEIALTTDTRIDLVANLYSKVLINPPTATGVPVGVAVGSLRASYYGWLGVAGLQPVLADGAITPGSQLCASNGTAGAVETATGTQAVVGISYGGIATTETGLVKLQLL